MHYGEIHTLPEKDPYHQPFQEYTNDNYFGGLCSVHVCTCLMVVQLTEVYGYLKLMLPPCRGLVSSRQDLQEKTTPNFTSQASESNFKLDHLHVDQLMKWMAPLGVY